MGGTSPLGLLSPAERLAAFVVNSGAVLPHDVLDFARRRLLDSLGSVLAAGPRSRLRALAVRLAGAMASGDEARFWFGDRRGTLEDVAFVNSIFVQAINQEDGGPGGHPASNVISAALAAAELGHVSGAELLAAVALAYEVQVRLGAASSGSAISQAIADRGLRGTTVTGTFGAAVATARLLALSADQTVTAINLAASLGAPGIVEPLQHGTDERSLQVAANTRNGVHAARLAAAGFSAAPTALDGDSGFYAVFTGAPGVPARALEGLAENWHAPRLINSRPYPTGGWNTGPLYCAAELVRMGITADQIDRVQIKHNWWRRVTGYIDPGPFKTVEQALLSVVFGVAVTFVIGGYDWPTALSAVGDERVDELASRMSVDGVATWPYTGGEVIVRLKSGQTRRVNAADMPEAIVRPDWEQQVVRFRQMTRATLSEADQEMVVSAVRDLDRQAEAGELVDVVVAVGGRQG